MSVIFSKVFAYSSLQSDLFDNNLKVYAQIGSTCV